MPAFEPTWGEPIEPALVLIWMIQQMRRCKEDVFEKTESISIVGQNADTGVDIVNKREHKIQERLIGG